MAVEPDTTVAPVEGLFVIDNRQRIVEWRGAVAALTHIPADCALGRPCYEVLKGRDSLGHAVCRHGCSAVKALRGKHGTANSSIVVSSHDGAPSRLCCELMALPQPPGGAIARLRAACAGRSTTDSHLARWLHTMESQDVVRDLSTLARLSTSLLVQSSSPLRQRLTKALDVLRDATGAESAEVFLAEPMGHGMLLTAYRGPFRSAFLQILRFEQGEGFPGLVMSQQEPIVTRALATDGRYLRSRVIQKGFRVCACVPLFGPGGVIGTLDVASCRGDLDPTDVLRVLTWASLPIGAMLTAQFRQFHDAVLTGAADAPAAGDEVDHLDRLLRGVLRQMLLESGAAGGIIQLFAGTPGQTVRRVTEGAIPAIGCAGHSSNMAHECPALIGNYGMALFGARRSWASPCQPAAGPEVVTYCLPMQIGDGISGLINIFYHKRSPSPPTRDLSLLLNMASQAALFVKAAWSQVMRRQHMDTLYRPWQPRPPVGRAVGAPDDATGPAAAVTPRRTGEVMDAYLDIRCFGPFTLYRRGSLVTPPMFQRRKALTLFKILLVRDGHPIARDTLIELLWPDADPNTGANRLYGVVHALRQIVEPPGAREGRTFIQSHEDLYVLNPQAPYRLDVKEFQANVSLGQWKENAGARDAAILAYEAAIRLYRGDFLEDEPYEDWCWGEQERLREIYLSTLKKLGTLCAETGDLERGIEYYRRALRVDPLREEVHHRLIRCLWQAGRRDEALRQYETCKDVLKQELDVGPLPELEDLVQRIRQGGKLRLSQTQPDMAERLR